MSQPPAFRSKARRCRRRDPLTGFQAIERIGEPVLPKRQAESRIFMASDSRSRMSV